MSKDMNTLQSTKHPSDFVPLRVLAALLERFDNSTAPVDPVQYAQVVTRLTQALASTEMSDALGDLLCSHPATAELYENMHYKVAGLCRSSLERSMTSEQQAITVIQRAMQSSRESSANGQS